MTLLRPLTAADREAVADLFARASDYVVLETGAPPDASTLDDFFQGAPPGKDPAAGLRLGTGMPLQGIADLAFGYPEPADAYVGLLLLDPAARGLGLGHAMVNELAARAQARGATRLLVAVLAQNPRGAAFWRREGFADERRFAGVPRGTRRHDLQRMARPLR